MSGAQVRLSEALGLTVSVGSASPSLGEERPHGTTHAVGIGRERKRAQTNCVLLVLCCLLFFLSPLSVVKVPQLRNVLRSQSTVGLSLSLYSIELFSQTIAVLYHRANQFPVATYGENISLGVGNMAILACFAKINREYG